ncbi:MAG: nucleotide pyrophosphohydrolase [Euryarchaeota archaeon]|nr:nucleotide pyrophosphohydrolase [Euryarchaeota archaeon]
MRISEFQSLIRELYLEKDSQRGAEATLLWLVEEVGELLEAHRKRSREGVEEEIADVIAWVVSYANLAGIEVEEALRRKYPGRCRYCNALPCRCEK